MSRPRNPTVNVGVRVHPEIRATLETLADAAGMTLAAYASEVLTAHTEQEHSRESRGSRPRYPSADYQ